MQDWTFPRGWGFLPFETLQSHTRSVSCKAINSGGALQAASFKSLLKALLSGPDFKSVAGFVPKPGRKENIRNYYNLEHN